MTAPAEQGIARYLVRYGAPGFVGCFGSVHRIHAPRGTRVAVATDRGEELGEVLVNAQAEFWTEDRRAPTGELLRVATPDDERRAAEQRDAHLPVLENCQRLAAERGLELVVVDGETLLDGERIVLYFLGAATEKLGPLSVELAQGDEARRVQFQSLEATAADDPPSLDLPSSNTSTKPPPPLTRQETWKSEAAGRWPAMAQALSGPTRERLSREDAFLLQLHGVYQQQDRDAKMARRAPPRERNQPDAGAPGRSRRFMVRTRAPGGRLTASQMLVHLDLAERFGGGPVRITARQGLQLHGVAKGDLHAVLREVNQALLTTLGACGDVSRNVMCCPAPLRGDRIRGRLQTLAAEISRHLTPSAPPYYEIWLDELPAGGGAAAVDEPVYGPTYLPRKIKVGLALPEDNCIEVYTQDIGLLAVVEGERLMGFDLLAGGGLGSSPLRENTFPRLAEPIAFVPADEALRVIDAVVQVHRDHGNRQDRRRARLKYLVAEWGSARFRAAIEERLERSLAPPRGVTVSGHDDHLGWRPQGDGRFFLGIPVLCGRLENTDAVRLKSTVRTLLERFRAPVRLTPQQNLLLCDLEASQRREVEQILRSGGVPLAEELRPLRRQAMACPALPTCGLAVAEAERVLPRLLVQLEQELAACGLADEGISLRIAGCPNACSRTATADIALVGRGAGKYAIYLGGRPHGDGLNVLYRDEVAESQIVPEICAVAAQYQAGRTPGESLADYLRRQSAQTSGLGSQGEREAF